MPNMPAYNKFAFDLLTSAVDGGYIKVMDPDTAPRYKKYIPYWA